MAGRQIAKKKPRRSGASSQGSHGDLEPSGWPIGGRAYVAQSAAADHPTDSQILPRWPAASIDPDQTEESPARGGARLHRANGEPKPPVLGVAYLDPLKGQRNPGPLKDNVRSNSDEYSDIKRQAQEKS